MRTPEQAKEIARTFIDRVMDKHDMGYVDEALAEEFIEHNPFDPSMGNDKKAALITFQTLFDNSPDMKAEIVDLVATGDRVAIRAVYSGTDSGLGWGAPMGAPATGKPFSVEGIDVAILDEDGKFREHYGIFDVMGMLGQLGLLPAPGGDHEH